MSETTQATPLEELTLGERVRQAIDQIPGKLGRLGLATSLVITGSLGVLTAEELSMATPAYADGTASDLGYPWPTDAQAPCEWGAAGGSNCLNPNDPLGQDKYDWGVYVNGVFQPYRGGGYEYRNCTDYVRWKEGTYGINVPTNLHNAKDWYDNVPSAERSTTPAAGEVAVNTSGGFGHVAFIESVNAGGTITVSEYNHNMDGHGDYRTGTPSALGFTEYVDFGLDPNKVTGGGGGTPAADKDKDGVADSDDSCPNVPGLAVNHGCPVEHVYTGMSDGRLLETYWGAGNALTTWQAANVSEPITAVTDEFVNNVQHVYLGTQGGAIWEVYWGGNNSLTQWQVADLNSPIDSISAQITPDGTQHVYTGTDSGAVSESYWGGGNAPTTYTMASTGSPVKGLSSQLTTNSIGTVQHVFSGTTDGKLRETYVGGGNALTTSVMANEAAPIAGIDSAIDGSGNTHIFSSTTAGKSYDTYWGPHASLTNAQMANLGRTITSMATRYVGGVWHIYNGSTDGNIWDTYWGGGNSLTTAPLYNMGYAVNKLSAQAQIDGTQHVFTATENGKEQETYLGGGNSLTNWQIANLGSGINAIASDIK